MNSQQLRQLHPYLWTLPKTAGEKRPEVLLYGSQSLLESMDDKVLQQIANVAALPGLAGAAMTMPDAHWGYGFPIGGVAAFAHARWPRLLLLQAIVAGLVATSVVLLLGRGWFPVVKTSPPATGETARPD